MAGLGQASGQVAASFKSSCTAVLLTEQFLLTDARCLQNNQVNYAVVGYNAGPAAAVYVPIEAQLTPPYYVRGSDHNSVALVKLATNVSFSSNVQPVCVQHPLSHDNSSSLTALSAGYSIDDAGQLQFGTGLEVVGRQINQVCSDSRFVNFNVPPEKYTCASNILACEFLANPPVLLEEEINGGTYLVVGVGGDNSNFCKGDAMAFVRVGEHLAWIKSIAFPQGDPVLTAFG
ncbi:serine protease 33-like [Hyalella azteca]|uniref:Serine protease 33-like n=1 Tax=Hyalella azteca TaxID=294128 RepID=A0A8B7NM75_HYAAZ|nr:serine protease 33-like [Hyalella azteca]